MHLSEKKIEVDNEVAVNTLIAKNKESEPLKIYERKPICVSKYNIYDYCEQAHCHTSQLGQFLYKVFLFSHLGTDNFSIPSLIATLQDLRENKGEWFHPVRK